MPSSNSQDESYEFVSPVVSQNHFFITNKSHKFHPYRPVSSSPFLPVLYGKWGFFGTKQHEITLLFSQSHSRIQNTPPRYQSGIDCLPQSLLQGLELYFSFKIILPTFPAPFLPHISFESVWHTFPILAPLPHWPDYHR